MERITNYKEYLAQPIQSLSLHKIVDAVGIYPEDFDTVYELINYPQDKIAWRAAWACEKIFNLNEAIATQALCIKMAYKLCLLEPELLPELKLYLENAEPEYYSSGVKCGIRNVLKKIH